MSTVKKIEDFDKNEKCSFVVNFKENPMILKEDTNISEPFIIMEHIKDDKFEYRHGFLAFSLNEKKLEDMALSFKNKEIGRELAVNYDHSADGSTIAAGWLKDVEVKKTDKGVALFARAEWTPRAVDHIKNKEYMYFSAECEIEGMVAKLGDKVIFDPKLKKSILLGGALTNNPYFKTTNLELSNNNDKGVNMNELELKAKEIEDLRMSLAAKEQQIAKFEADKLSFEAEKKANEEKMKESMILNLMKDLPAPKHEIVKAKLSKLSTEMLSEIGADIVKAHDTRIVPPEINLNLSEKAITKECSVAEFADEQLNIMYKKGE
jgi:phage I-like protein